MLVMRAKLTAARRLIDSLHAAYGRFIDAIVLGRSLCQRAADDSTGSARLWRLHRPQEGKPMSRSRKRSLFSTAKGCVRSTTISDKKECIQFWDADDIETLDTYEGKVRVIRAVITKA